MAAEWIGWASAALLLATIVQQVYTQWRSGATAGVSRWLFIGQTLASIGFTAYSALTDNRVFLVVNAALVLSALAGQAIYWRNKRHGALKKQRAGEAGPV